MSFSHKGGKPIENPQSIGLRIIKFPLFVSAPCDHSNLKEAPNNELVTEISEDTRKPSLAYMQLHIGGGLRTRPCCLFVYSSTPPPPSRTCPTR